MKITSVICAILMFLNSLLHIGLIFGAPLGEYVLGGQYVVFPLKMRLVSVFFALLLSFMGVIYLKLAGVVHVFISNKLMIIFLIINTVLMTYAIFGNLFLTDSIKETYVMTPFTLVASVCSVIALIKYRMVK